MSRNVEKGETDMMTDENIKDNTDLSKDECIAERIITSDNPPVFGHEDIKKALTLTVNALKKGEEYQDLVGTRASGWAHFKGLGLKGGSPIPQANAKVFPPRAVPHATTKMEKEAERHRQDANSFSKKDESIDQLACCSSDLVIDSTEQIVSDSSEHIANESEIDFDSSDPNIAHNAEIVSEASEMNIADDSSENAVAYESEIASDSSNHKIAHESDVISENNIADASSEPISESADISYTPLSSILFMDAAQLPNESNKLQTSNLIEKRYCC